MRNPVPAHERAAVLDRLAAIVRDRRDEFAETIAREAGKPIATAQAEADRAVQTILFSAVEARSLGGEVIGMDAHPAGAGHAGLVIRLPIGIVGAISPVQLPAQPGRAQDRPGVRRGLRGRAQAGRVDAALGAPAGAGLRRRGPARRVAERRRRPLERDRRRHGRRRSDQADHVHRLIRRRLEAARARLAQEGVARARQLDADDRARRRRHGQGGDRRGRQRLLLRRPELHLGAARVRAGRGLRRLRRPPAAEGRGARDRRSDGSRHPGGARDRPGQPRPHPRLGQGGGRPAARRCSRAARPTMPACCGRRCSATSVWT